jgi:hypothetical protein
MLLHTAQTPTPNTHIRLVASDVDGTLLTTAHTIAPRTVQAIRRMVQEKGVLFVPATGKSRGGVRNALGALGRELTGPPSPSREGEGGLWGVGGVYLQVGFGVWFGLVSVWISSFRLLLADHLYIHISATGLDRLQRRGGRF